MANSSSTRIDESDLTKGQRRKLSALRKSVGDDIGEQAFAAWLSSQSAASGGKSDENAANRLCTWLRLREFATRC